MCEGFIRVSKHEETKGSTRLQAKCFHCFQVFGNSDETLTLVFEIAPQLRLRNKRKWKYSRIFHMLSAKNCIVMVICIFRKGANHVIMFWAI